MSEERSTDFQIGVPDPSFRLSPEERARVPKVWDVDALERLLGMMPPEAREEMYRSFLPPEPGLLFNFLVELRHPKLQAALEEVWVPYWDGYTDEEMDREPDYMPGRVLAKKRRREQSE